jgi:hypothetical protein
MLGVHISCRNASYERSHHVGRKPPDQTKILMALHETTLHEKTRRKILMC